MISTFSWEFPCKPVERVECNVLPVRDTLGNNISTSKGLVGVCMFKISLQCYIDFLGRIQFIPVMVKDYVPLCWSNARHMIWKFYRKSTAFPLVLSYLAIRCLLDIGVLHVVLSMIAMIYFKHIYEFRYWLKQT